MHADHERRKYEDSRFVQTFETWEVDGDFALERGPQV